jgi:nitrate/TMAO reductase-like tetraheme cytochrome c subunit
LSSPDHDAVQYTRNQELRSFLFLTVVMPPTINTREKFLEKCLELAQHEWARIKANDSLECRNCHDYDYMDFTRQSPRASYMHTTYLATKERTCIDCHKGIAHRLPEMTLAPGKRVQGLPRHRHRGANRNETEQNQGVAQPWPKTGTR